MKIIRLGLFAISVAVFFPKAYAQDILEKNKVGTGIGTVDDKYGLYDKTKKIILEPKYELIEMAGDNYFVVTLEGKMGLYDAKGVEVLKPVYSNIEIVDDRKPLLAVEENGKRRIYIHKKVEDILGGVKSNSSFFEVEQTEVSVGYYLAFILMASQDPDEYRISKSMPDTNHMAYNNKLIFRKLLAMSQESTYEEKKYWGSYRAGYNKFLLPKSILDNKKLKEYLDMPITGVSFTQAKEYLNWYSDHMSEYAPAAYHYQFRLPTREEWESLAESGLNASFKANHIIDSMNVKKCMLYNTIPDKSVCSNLAEKEKRYGENVVPIYSFFPDNNGMFNVYGNVAEMTSAEGVAVGGSFKHYANHSRTNLVQKYEGPQEWLGFRWVVEYIP